MRSTYRNSHGIGQNRSTGRSSHSYYNAQGYGEKHHERTTSDSAGIGCGNLGTDKNSRCHHSNDNKTHGTGSQSGDSRCDRGFGYDDGSINDYNTFSQTDYDGETFAKNGTRRRETRLHYYGGHSTHTGG